MVVFQLLSERELRVLKETRLRNLKRKYAKLIQHADLTDEASNIKMKIDCLEKELS